MKLRVEITLAAEVPFLYHGPDLSGIRVGKLVVRNIHGRNRHGAWYWKCICDCGIETICRTESINGKGKGHKTQSCGCITFEVAKKTFLTHGESRSQNGKATPEYSVWKSMLRRCLNPNATGFEDYGGRGITICTPWQRSFESFLADMGRRPSMQHTLDRKENDGPYSPENCRWATRKEQAENTRRNVKLTARGQTQTISEWARKLGVSSSCLKKRIAHGWSDERVLFTPVNLNYAHSKTPRKYSNV